MIDCRFFYDSLKGRGIDFFCGVPDSLLKGVSACIAEQAEEGRHVVAANEGNAVALAVGHYLATGKIGLVYMQNSGLGNALNPLVSLADPLVYGIPLLLLIGWRGRPGVTDEPQHLKQGKITLPLLDTLKIKYSMLPESNEEFKKLLFQVTEVMELSGEPYALIAGKNSFGAYQSPKEQAGSYPMQREDALAVVLPALGPDAVVVSTTGKLSREIYEYRAARGEGHQRDFLNVGSMGHASQIALGIAVDKPGRMVFCLDGDGAFLMHMGGLAIIGSSGAKNFKHILFNNGSHDSVGGQPTAGFNVDFCKIAKACGYKEALLAVNRIQLEEGLEIFKSVEGPALLEVRLCTGARKDLGRPTISPRDNKREFMNYLKS